MITIIPTIISIKTTASQRAAVTTRLQKYVYIHDKNLIKLNCFENETQSKRKIVTFRAKILLNIGVVQPKILILGYHAKVLTAVLFTGQQLLLLFVLRYVDFTASTFLTTRMAFIWIVKMANSFLKVPQMT
ncbi:MAG: hypothetical protein KL787_02050 [Taibaiella sp.]|nr:hypothetical protein [Taibaiella sp.]